MNDSTVPFRAPSTAAGGAPGPDADRSGVPGGGGGPGSSRLAIDVAFWEGRWHLLLNGPLDRCGAGTLLGIVQVLADRRAPAVDLDLGGVTEIDNPGWQAALHAQGLLVAAGAEVRLTPPPPPFGHPAGSTGSGHSRSAA